MAKLEAATGILVCYVQLYHALLYFHLKEIYSIFLTLFQFYNGWSKIAKLPNQPDK
jgi:hypothetical protein